MNKIRILLLSLLMVIGLAAVMPESAYAINVLDDACLSNPDSALCEGKDEDAGDIVGPIVEAMLLILGSISVIVIIVAGIMFTVSAGDPAATKKAKDAVLYAVVGLVIAISAYAIVAFVAGYF